MSTQVQTRRGNTTQTSVFTGAVAEITVDTDKKTLVVHDGSTSGGFALARESALTSNLIFSQAAFNTANGAFTAANAATATDITQNNSITAAFTAANTPSHVANSAAIYANGAFTAANAASATDATQNNSITASFIHANASFAFANTISGGAAIDNVAREIAISAATFANTPSHVANSASIYANGAFTKANTAATIPDVLALSIALG
jgi:hypothetical protein